MQTFEGQVVWVTGASSGIGEALAYELNWRGAELIISARREQKLEEVKANCLESSRVHVVPLDLADFDALPEKYREIRNTVGSVDYLFNNGGVSQRSYAVETDFEVVRRVMDINFLGTVRLTQLVLPSMIERQKGHIVVTSSVMGKFGTQLRSTYAASKHALHGYFDSLREEVYDKNIAITLVCPGYIRTNVTKNALTGDGEKLNEMGEGQKEGMSPETFVRKLLPAVEKRKPEVYIGGLEVAGVYLKRLFPRLLKWVLRRTKVT